MFKIKRLGQVRGPSKSLEPGERIHEISYHVTKQLALCNKGGFLLIFGCRISSFQSSRAHLLWRSSKPHPNQLGHNRVSSYRAYRQLMAMGFLNILHGILWKVS